ncbi:MULTISPECIES: hypothetical protein [Amycolatopsis]|uniref:Uncharacterized protein n=2 Tax=Amycolatopsis TaxID=1813 RepID=A0A1I3WM70_9PSEU|nr:hypothetical protein [Amycolatopsis sacchari]SFK08572.1 hypothetical protein SAMN05421835_113133 [Amycolatopsis sacchari]
MSMSVLRPYGLDSAAGDGERSASPFAPAGLAAAEAPVAAPAQVLNSPFAEAAVAAGEAGRGAETAGALLAELDDEEFAETLDVLVDEAAARHLRSVGTWSSASEAPALASIDTGQWLEELARESDRVLRGLEAHFGERPAGSLQDGEIEAVAGLPAMDGFTHPLDAQQLFLGGLLDKAKKLAKGVGKLAKKGFSALGNLALGPLFATLRKLVRPLLKKVLDTAIGKLPESLRPLAGQLAAKLNGETGLAEEFDEAITEAVTLRKDTLEEHPALDGYEAVGNDLDEARARLNRELSAADPEVPPTEQLQQFLPVVMAALPLVRTAVKVVGRDRIVNKIAELIARLIQGMVGPEAAKLLSRHIASTGLGLLGLETSEPESLGAEAMVAATEDTVREVLKLPPESLENDLVLEAAVQDAFAESVARHMPAAVLRSELVEREFDGEHGVWVLMPRATRPCFRYKKYSHAIPVRVSRPIARAVVLSSGETLERRLLDDGTETWPVEGEVELYELLPGGTLGHVAAFESDDGAVSEFEVLTESAAGTLMGRPHWGHNGHRVGSRRPGSRFFRFHHRGRPLHHRHFFALGFDLTAPQPVLRVNLPIGERDSHELVAQLQRRQLVQVVSTVRKLLGEPAVAALGRRLEHLMSKHGIAAPAGAAQALAGTLAGGMLRSLAQQLPAAAATLAQAAQDPASGVTLTFTFAFTDRAAVAAGTPAGDPALTVRAGQHRD